MLVRGSELIECRSELSHDQLTYLEFQFPLTSLSSTLPGLKSDLIICNGGSVIGEEDFRLACYHQSLPSDSELAAQWLFDLVKFLPCLHTMSFKARICFQFLF